MDLNRFRTLCDAWGGDLNRWPERARAAARGLAATDPDAAAALREAATLDAMLDAIPNEEPPGEWLTATLMRDAKRMTQRAYPRRALMAQAAAVLICLSVGVVAGGLAPMEDEAVTETAIAWAMGAETSDWGTGE